MFKLPTTPNTIALSKPYPPRSKDGPAGVVFVLDSSGSIGSDNWQVILQYATQVMEGLRNRAKENLSSAVTWIKSNDTKHRNLQEYVSDPAATEVVHVGVVVYSDKATTHWDLNVRKSTEQLARDIRGLGFEGRSTNTYDGLIHAENIFKLCTTVYSKHIVVLITGGRSNDRQQTIRQAESMHANGVEIFVIGVGDVSQDEMDQVGSKPVSEDCHYVMDHAALQATTAKITTVTYTAVQREIKPELAAAPEPEAPEPEAPEPEAPEPEVPEPEAPEPEAPEPEAPEPEAPEPEAPRPLELEDYVRREFIQIFVLLFIWLILKFINSMFGWE